MEGVEEWLLVGLSGCDQCSCWLSCGCCLNCWLGCCCLGCGVEASGLVDDVADELEEVDEAGEKELDWVYLVVHGGGCV